MRRSIDEMEQGAELVGDERAREEQQIASRTARLDGCAGSADTLSNELAELNRRAGAARDARAGLEVQQAEATARLDLMSAKPACRN